MTDEEVRSPRHGWPWFHSWFQFEPIPADLTPLLRLWNAASWARRTPSLDLSPRNLAILSGLAEPPGRTIERVAKELSVSTATVKADLRQTYEALGVSTQASAVAAALRRGLIE